MRSFERLCMLAPRPSFIRLYKRLCNLPGKPNKSISILKNKLSDQGVIPLKGYTSPIAPPSVGVHRHQDPQDHRLIPLLPQQTSCYNVPSTVITDYSKLSLELLSLSLPLLFLSPFPLPNLFQLSQPPLHKQSQVYFIEIWIYWVGHLGDLNR